MLNLSAVLRSGFTGLLGFSLPARIKRMVFLASLVASIKEVDAAQDTESLRKINELLELCSSEDAMRLPVQLRHVIWNDRVIHDAQRVLHEPDTNDSVLESLIVTIKEQIPTWLRYGDAEIDKDLHELMSKRSEVL